MNKQSNFTVPTAITDRLLQALKARGCAEIANQFYFQHPLTLGPEYIVGTGGGCEAYFFDIKHDGKNVLVVWTSNDGCDLPEANNWMVGLYQGEEITENALVLLSDDDS